MAQMYPRRVAGNAQFGEKLVYAELEKLPDNWVVFHDFWEHYRDNNGQYVNYEADFVVLVPDHGYVVLEVKDWPHARILNGEWQSKSSLAGADWVSMGHKVSPLHQADIACQRLQKGLTSVGIFPERMDWQPERRCMAILTNCVPEDFDTAPVAEDARLAARTNIPLNTLYICGEEALCNGLQERLLSLFTKRRRLGRHMNAEMMAAITAYLAPTLYFRMDLRNYLRLMDEAAAPLQELLPLLEESKGGIHVEGCAGSGKTVLATREAARQAAKLPRDGQHRLLMLCYNHNLVHTLRRHPELREQADVLTISNFHEYCEHTLLEPAGQSGLMDRSGQGDPLSDAALDYLSRHTAEAPVYDAIFVDEAQDFRSVWWKLIERWLHPEGKLYIFADSRQKLYAHRGPLPSLPTRIRLRRNLRNAREIAEYGAAYLPETRRAESLDLCGTAPLILPGTDDPQERAEGVRACICHIRENNNLHVPNRDIVVLSPWAAHNGRSCFPYLEDILDYAHGPEDAAAIEERHLRCRCADSEKILGDTIKSFKGLESAYIILTDICAEDESRGFNLDAFYVACTRAKFGLCIVPTKSGELLAKRHHNASPK